MSLSGRWRKIREDLESGRITESEWIAAAQKIVNSIPDSPVRKFYKSEIESVPRRRKWLR